MKAIETVYKGYRFRSRLEARWAVFFETLGIQWEYEKEGYNLDGVWYLPDFYLPQFRCWVEIKPDLPSKQEREKAIRLCLAASQHVYVFAGSAWSDARCFGFSPFVRPYSMEREVIRPLIEANSSAYWLSSDEYIVAGHDYWGGDFDRELIWTSRVGWMECATCRKVSLFALGGLRPQGALHALTCERANMLHGVESDHIASAYIAARQARFEHGEKG